MVRHATQLVGVRVRLRGGSAAAGMAGHNTAGEAEGVADYSDGDAHARQLAAGLGCMVGLGPQAQRCVSWGGAAWQRHYNAAREAGARHKGSGPLRGEIPRTLKPRSEPMPPP